MNARQPGESFEKYRARRNQQAKDRKRVGRGVPVWTSCVLLPGDEMLRAWMQKHPGAGAKKVAKVKAAFPKHKLFKVAVGGTYQRKDVGGEKHIPGRTRVLPSNRPRAIAAREAKGV